MMYIYIYAYTYTYTCICTYLYIYIYIYIYTPPCGAPGRRAAPRGGPSGPWLRTSGVNTNGAAAKVMDFDRLGKKVCPGTFGKIQVGQRECPKSPSVKKHEICSDPISADPMCPFPRPVHAIPSVLYTVSHHISHHVCHIRYIAYRSTCIISLITQHTNRNISLSPFVPFRGPRRRGSTGAGRRARAGS